MSLHRSAPRTLSDAISELRERVAPRSVLAEAQMHWPQLVGPLIAAEAHPISERAGVLTVACSAAVWAAELDSDSELILERLNSHLQTGRIERLRCVVSSS